MNRISFLNRGYAFKGLLAVLHAHTKTRFADNGRGIGRSYKSMSV